MLRDGPHGVDQLHRWLHAEFAWLVGVGVGLVESTEPSQQKRPPNPIPSTPKPTNPPTLTLVEIVADPLLAEDRDLGLLARREGPSAGRQPGGATHGRVNVRRGESGGVGLAACVGGYIFGWC